MTHKEYMRRCELKYLSDLLENNATVTDAARAAGLNRTYLYKMLDRHGLLAKPRGIDVDPAGQRRRLCVDS